MTINKLTLSNSFMELYVASMNKIFKVVGYVESYQQSQSKALEDKMRRDNLVPVSSLPLSPDVSIISTQYSWFCRSDIFNALTDSKQAYTNFYMRVDELFFPISFIGKDISEGNKHAESRHDDIGFIATDPMGNHYWASNNGFKNPIKDLKTCS